MFHVPPKLDWDAGSIQHSLQLRGMNARVCGDNVVLQFPRIGSFRYLLRLLDLLAPHFRQTMTIEYCRDRKMGTVRLHCHPKISFAFVVQHVQEVMRDHGFVEVSTETGMRSIVESMGAENLEIEAAINDYDSHQSSFQPESANEWAQKRDLILARIEALVANTAFE